jgi:glycine cleavage system H protein
MTPADLHYTSDHEWVRTEADGSITFGITDYAQNAMGDIVFVQLPDVGAAVPASDTCAEVESIKSVAEVYAPVSGTVLEVNTALEASPELVNTDPYAGGWLVRMTPDDPTAIGELLNAAAYDALVAGL